MTMTERRTRADVKQLEERLLIKRQDGIADIRKYLEGFGSVSEISRETKFDAFNDIVKKKFLEARIVYLSVINDQIEAGAAKDNKQFVADAQRAAVDDGKKLVDLNSKIKGKRLFSPYNIAFETLIKKVASVDGSNLDTMNSVRDLLIFRGLIQHARSVVTKFNSRD